MLAASMDLNLTNVPGLRPPPGQLPNFEHPWSLRRILYGYVILTLVLTTTSTVVRFYTRLSVLRNMGPDDYVMVVALCMYAVYCVVGVKAVQHGAGVHQWDVRLTEIKQYAYWGFLGEVLYPIAITLVKLSICLQILRIFVVHRGREFWIVWSFTFIQIAWCLQSFLTTLLQCVPVKKVYDPAIPGTCLVNFEAFALTFGVFNLVFDVLLWSLPLYFVAQLQLPLRKKIAVAGVFLIGSIAVIVDVLRVIFSVRWFQEPEDATFKLTLLSVFTYAEIVSGILAGNGVCLPAFFNDIKDKTKSMKSKCAKKKGVITANNNMSVEMIQHSAKPKFYQANAAKYGGETDV